MCNGYIIIFLSILFLITLKSVKKDGDKYIEGYSMEYSTVIVHDWLTVFAGSEKVVEKIYELYPSPICTLVADRASVQNSVFSDAEITTSFIQNYPFQGQSTGITFLFSRLLLKALILVNMI